MLITRLAIFVSGNGTNCENIIRYFADSDKVKVVLVLSNRADAYALVRARKYGVPTVVMPKDCFNKEDKLMTVLREYNIDFIALAGFLLMIPDFLTAVFHCKIVNIHPALLPKFGGKGMYGHYVHQAVKDAGEIETGITVHWVNNVCDGGDIIAQWHTPIKPDDTVKDIEYAIHLLEQAHYPATIQAAINKLSNKY